MKLEREQTVSEIQEADTDNPEAVEAAAAHALENTDINFPYSNEVQKFINQSPEVSDD